MVALLAWGCSYTKDIADLDDRIDALEQGKIADIETQLKNMQEAVDALQKTLNDEVARLDGSISTLTKDLADLEDVLDSHLDDFKTLQDLVNSNYTELKGLIENLQKELDAAEKRLDDLEQDLADNYYTKDEIDETLKNYVTLAKLNEEFGKLNALITALTGRVDTLEDDVDALEANDEIQDGAIEQLQKDMADVQEKAQTALTTANEALTTAKDALGKVNQVIETLGAYYKDKNLEETIDLMLQDIETLKGDTGKLREDLDALREDHNALREEFDGLLTSDKFNDAVAREIAKSLEEGGAIDEAITKKVNALDEKLTKLIEEKVKALQDQIDALRSRVDDLASRIQSISFLPEYNDGKATSVSYVIGSYVPADQQQITARFVVAPASYAKAFEASEGVEFRATELSTRSGAFIVAEHQAIKCIDEEAGIIEVTGVFPGAATEYSVALAVKAAVSEGGDVQNDVVSDFALVATSVINLGSEYEFVSEDDPTQAYKGRIAKHAWSDGQGMEVVLEGYELRLSGMTLEEAAEFYNIDVEALTPEFNPGVYLATPAYSGETDWKKIFSMTSTPTKDYKTVVVDMLSTNKDNVNAVLAVEAKFTFGSDVILYPGEEFRYEIVKEDVNTPASYSESWTYERELNLSDLKSNPAVPYAKDFDINFEEIFGEKVSGIILEAYNNDWIKVQDVNPASVDLAVSDFGGLSVHLVSKTYSFGNTYTFNLVVDDNPYYAVKIPVTIELGAKPADTVVDLGTFTTTLSSNEMVISPLAVQEKLSAIFEGTTYYKNMAELQQSLNFGAFKGAYQYRVNGGSPVMAGDADLAAALAALLPYSDNESIKVKPEILTACTDIVSFATTVETWYGVKYTFTAEVGFDEPQYKLVPNDHYVDIDGIVNVAGREQGGLYVLDAVYFADYFKIEGNVVDEIEVDFDAEKSTITDLRNVPVVGNNIDRAASVYNWGAKDRELKFTAQLYMKVGSARVKVGESYDITLKTPDPILRDKIVYGENVAYKEIGDIATANYWSTLEVYGILEPERNLINQSAISVSDMFTTPNLYQLDPSGTKIGNIKLYKAGTDEEVMDAYKYLKVDPAAGTVSFEFNNALWNYDIDARFEIGLDYYLDNNDPISIPAQITFRQQK